MLTFIVFPIYLHLIYLQRICYLSLYCELSAFWKWDMHVRPTYFFLHLHTDEPPYYIQLYLRCYQNSEFTACQSGNFFFFFRWPYSPPWVLACRTIPLHFFLSSINSLHLLNSSTWRSLSTQLYTVLQELEDSLQLPKYIPSPFPSNIIKSIQLIPLLNFRNNKFFYCVGLLTPRQTPNLEDQGISFCLGHHPWPVWHGRPYTQDQNKNKLCVSDVVYGYKASIILQQYFQEQDAVTREDHNLWSLVHKQIMKMENWMENPKCSEKPLSQCHFVYHKSQMTWSGIKPSPPRRDAAK